MDKEEEQLIKKAQRGNLQAFEDLVHQYDAKIMRLIFNMVNDVEDTRDLYQEVVIKVFKSINKFRFQSQFFTWLFRITINTCLNYRKRIASHSYASLEEYETGEQTNWKIVTAMGNQNPEQEVLNSELHLQIQQALDQLSPRERAVFILRHYHGHKLNQIAVIMNCSEGTIKNYMFRAVKKLKKLLSGYCQI